jgi:hypothetical protein
MGGNRERCDPTRPEHTARLPQGGHVVVEVLDHLAEDDRVEPRVFERQCEEIGSNDRSTDSLDENLARHPRDVCANDVETAILEQPRERPLAGSDVENPTARLSRQEQLQQQALPQLVPWPDEVGGGPPLVWKVHGSV